MFSVTSYYRHSPFTLDSVEVVENRTLWHMMLNCITRVSGSSRPRDQSVQISFYCFTCKSVSTAMQFCLGVNPPSVHFGEDQSVIVCCSCCPTGIVLGLLLFLLCTDDMLKFVQNHRLTGRSDADDTSINLHVHANLGSCLIIKYHFVY